MMGRMFGSCISEIWLNWQPVYNEPYSSSSKVDQVSFQIKPNVDNAQCDNKADGDELEHDERKAGVQTRSRIKNADKKDREQDVHNYYIEQLNQECLDTLVENIMTVEIPVKEHGRPECVDAKKTEFLLGGVGGCGGTRS